jgi:hypothetical protein
MPADKRYGRRHQAKRRLVAGQVAAGKAVCARCGNPILPGQKWDLGHDDLNPTRHSGPEHAGSRDCPAGGNRASVTHLKERLAEARGEPAGNGVAREAAAEVKDPRTGLVREPGESEEEHWLRNGPPDRWGRHWSGGYTDQCRECRRLGRACPDADDG